MPHSVNFARWLARLGFKDGREPEIIRAVQPVQVVGDVSFLLPAILPPSGSIGGLVPAGGVGTFGAFEVGGGTRGGVAFEVQLLNTGASSDYTFRLGAVPFPMANPLAMVPQVYQAGGSVAFRAGTVATAGPTDVPMIRNGTNGPVQILSLFCPAGQFAMLQHRVDNAGMRIFCSWQEYEAAANAE